MQPWPKLTRLDHCLYVACTSFGSGSYPEFLCQMRIPTLVAGHQVHEIDHLDVRPVPGL